MISVSALSLQKVNRGQCSGRFDLPDGQRESGGDHAILYCVRLTVTGCVRLLWPVGHQQRYRAVSWMTTEG